MRVGIGGLGCGSRGMAVLRPGLARPVRSCRGMVGLSARQSRRIGQCLENERQPELDQDGPKRKPCSGRTPVASTGNKAERPMPPPELHLTGPQAAHQEISDGDAPFFALTLSALTSVAQAEPVKLTYEQMDNVTAGGGAMATHGGDHYYEPPDYDIVPYEPASICPKICTTASNKTGYASATSHSVP
jgi:hypothetical protein